MSIAATRSYAQTTAFTYQGWLNTDGAPASGDYDLTFTMYSSTSIPGTIIAGPLTNTPTVVSNGLFTVTLDFGPGIFTGADRWLEIGVRTNGGGAFNNLAPRQKITAAPYAIHSGISATAASATTAITATTANNFSGSLAGNVTGTQGATVVATVGGQSAANVASGASAANAATSANIANAIVRRDASGNFSAGTVTGSLSGNATTATTANNFSGSLAGDVTGTQGATVVATVGGQSAANVASGANAANAATSANTPSAIVRRDASGNFSAGTVTGSLSGNATTATTANNFSGSLAGNVTGTQGATVVATVGGLSAANVASGANAANAATSANTANAIVRRDASGNFSAGAITATSVSGNGAGLTQLNAANLATGTVNDARLSTNVALRNATQTFTGNNTFLGSVGVGNTASATRLTVTTVSDVYGIEHTDGTRRLGTFLNADGAWLGTAGPDALLLFVNNSSAGPSVTIDPSSRVGIGRTPTANKLEVAGSASKDSAGSWLANSDARIKQDVQPVGSALETLEKVRLVSFRYTDNYRAAHESIADRRYLNVLAQEFREVFPNDVKSSGETLPDGSEILQVDTYPLTIYSAAAIQELNQKVEAGSQKSEDRIQKLETQNAQLRGELNELKSLLRSMNEKLNGGTK